MQPPGSQQTTSGTSKPSSGGGGFGNFSGVMSGGMSSMMGAVGQSSPWGNNSPVGAVPNIPQQQAPQEQRYPNWSSMAYPQSQPMQTMWNPVAAQSVTQENTPTIPTASQQAAPRFDPRPYGPNFGVVHDAPPPPAPPPTDYSLPWQQAEHYGYLNQNTGHGMMGDYYTSG